MRANIIANGWLSHPVHLLPGDVIIAANGGTRHCLEHGLKPDYVIGDLDSLTAEHLEILHTLGSQIIEYPRRKDYTDLELALQHAQEIGATEIIIQAALGDRWDQTIANLLMPVAVTSARVSLIDGKQEIHLLRSAETIRFHGKPGDTVSLISLSPQANGVVTQNLEYPLNDETLYLGSTRGVSNVMLAEAAEITLKEGLLICTLIHNS